MSTNTHSDDERLSPAAGSVMRWTRNTIFKVRCVIAEMREIGPWVDSLAMPDSDPVELAKYSKAMKRDLLRGHWWKLRSLAKELPLALVLDTPGLRTIWWRWKKRKHSQNKELSR
jgi:hypothetical protein